jgi:DNA-directed RNA polymerase specialized sigma24 family protein
MTVFANHQNEFNRFRQGQKWAFKFFAHHYGPAVYLFLFWKCGDPENAKSITGKAFRSAFRLRHTMLNEDHLVGFLFVTAYHQCVWHQWRTSTRWKPESAIAISVEEAYRFLDDHDASWARVLSETESALSRLPRQQGSVLRKFYLEAKSIATVAQELKLNPQAVVDNQNSALYALRQRLSELEFMLVAMGLLLTRLQRQ